jgi:hypothetical protein
MEINHLTLGAASIFGKPTTPIIEVGYFHGSVFAYKVRASLCVCVTTTVLHLVCVCMRVSACVCCSLPLTLPRLVRLYFISEWVSEFGRESSAHSPLTQ